MKPAPIGTVARLRIAVDYAALRHDVRERSYRTHSAAGVVQPPTRPR